MKRFKRSLYVVDKCNTNYDANNNNSGPKLNVSLVTILIISLISFIVSWNKFERYQNSLFLKKCQKTAPKLIYSDCKSKDA